MEEPSVSPPDNEVDHDAAAAQEQRGDLRPGGDGNAGVPLDLVDQVARHGRVQRLVPDDDVNLGTAAAQEQRSLAG